MVFAGASGIDKFELDIFSDVLQVAIAPLLPGIRACGAAAFFHRPVVRPAGRMGIYFIGRAPDDVHAAAVRFPTGDAGSVMLVGISNAAIVLLFEIVIREVRIAAAAQPKLFNELLALFVRRELEKRSSLFRSEERRVGKECRSRWSP